TVFLGGLLRHFMEKTSKSEDEKEQRRGNGILLGSGLVGGEGLLGVAIAGVAFYYGRAPRGIGEEWSGAFAPFLGLAAFGLLAYIFINRIKSAK
ncbi:MAG: oligopeptide transporter, OPT family, partial [Candidatus Marinimicrobia bacterium]|nr:oligopeptide transporter, OPT family [Candidatus Neomarinimicrobiota bacterium]